MILEKDVDALMERTQNRPLPANRLTVEAAWGFVIPMRRNRCDVAPRFCGGSDAWERCFSCGNFEVFLAENSPQMEKFSHKVLQVKEWHAILSILRF